MQILSGLSIEKTQVNVKKDQTKLLFDELCKLIDEFKAQLEKEEINYRCKNAK